MEIHIVTQTEKTLVAISGRIDSASAGQFQQAVEPLHSLAEPNIEIDCSQLEYTSSQGLRIFLMLQKKVQSNKGTLVLKNMQPKVKEVFDITGFSNIITIV